jgi:hypothetical protein
MELPVRHGHISVDLDAGSDSSIADEETSVEEDNGSMSEVSL